MSVPQSCVPVSEKGRSESTGMDVDVDIGGDTE